MKEKIIVKRYAEAFVGFAKGTFGLAKAIEELRLLKRVVQDNPQFLGLLGSPQITYTEKCAFLDSTLKENFSDELLHFLKFLLEKMRIGFIIDIADYIRVNYAHGEAVDAVLKASYPLDLDLIQMIKQKMESKLQKKLNFYLELDADLLGGVEVIVGNTVFDGSVRRRLDDLKEKLKTVRVI